MLKNIPFQRLIAYIIILGCLPIILAFFSVQNTMHTIRELREQLPTIQEQATAAEGKVSKNRVVRTHFSNADHFYIDKHLESLTFLEDEIAALNELAESSAYGNQQAIKSRLDFLSGPENRMVFTEGTVQSYPGFQETQETLLHSIEVNEDDLKNILSKIEGVNIGNHSPGPDRPQLIITDFRIEKKNTFASNEVFILNLKVLKREFL